MKNLTKLIPLLLLSFSAVAGPGDELGLSPFWRWKEIETERFRITYPEELEEQAKVVAQHYENAHETLKYDLDWEPEHKVQVLLTDGTDAANGMTTPVSRFGMILYLTPPETWFSTSYYDDWLKLLVYHEYTHYLNMDPTREAYTVLRFLLGDVLLPNSLWPSWMLEGFAVYYETKYTKVGRGRSPYYSMVVRSLIEDDLLEKSLTLDRVAGGTPYAPGGESAYLFGYMLTNEAAKEGPKVLTDLTVNSSRRIPYFINGNLENIIDKDWYQLWDRYVANSKIRAAKDLETIKSQPLSHVEFLDTKVGDTTEKTIDVMGTASSPDLEWIAYSMNHQDRWMTLYLQNAKTGETKILEDKFLGVGIAFTPDSKRIISSSLGRQNNFQFYSDLKVYEIDTEKSYYLTNSARAKDPTLSPDGKNIAYVVSEGSSNDLYAADLDYENGRLVLKNPKKIIDAAMFDRVANPKFTPDGKSIVFSLKTNGQIGEDLMIADLSGGAMRTLVKDEARNRFPAMDTRNNLYFVSDRTGVDNLYRYDQDGKSTQVTNLTTGIWLPTLRGNQAIASVYRGTGWALAKVDLNEKGYDSSTLKIAKFDAPDPVDSKNAPSTAGYTSHDYTPWKSLAPRQWFPLVIADSESFYLGAQASSYDATFQHIYSLTLATDTQVKLPDASLFYSNRMLGPSFDLSASLQTTDTIKENFALGVPGSYTRERDFGLGISYPFLHTIGRFVPRLGIDWSQDHHYNQINKNRFFQSKTSLVPTQDISLTYGDARSSRLSVWSERGQVTFAGVRRYDLSGAHDSYKALASHREFFSLGNHFVLSPLLRGMRTSRTDRRFYDANVNVLGRENRIVNPIPGDNFDEVYARGYGQTSITGLREAYTLALDLRFPIAQIFRGWGTNPVFANQIFMQFFAEDTYLPGVRSDLHHLSSAGAGLRASVDLLQYIPLTMAVDYHHGFNNAALGGGEVFFSLQATSPLAF